MDEQTTPACLSVDLSEEDIQQAMKEISGYLDITASDFRDLYIRAYRNAVARLLHSVLARDVMNRDVAWVRDSAPLFEAADLMARRRVAGVPVLDRHDRLAGVLSEKDFLAALDGNARGGFMEIVAECLKGGGCLAAPMRNGLVSDLMSSPAITAAEDASVAEIADLFLSRRINRVPITDPAGKMVGIVSRSDILRASPLSIKP